MVSLGTWQCPVGLVPGVRGKRGGRQVDGSKATTQGLGRWGQKHDCVLRTVRAAKGFYTTEVTTRFIF